MNNGRVLSFDLRLLDWPRNCHAPEPQIDLARALAYRINRLFTVANAQDPDPLLSLWWPHGELDRDICDCRVCFQCPTLQEAWVFPLSLPHDLYYGSIVPPREFLEALEQLPQPAEWFSFPEIFTVR